MDGEEILDILFDESDPLLKDIDWKLDDDFSADFEELKNSLFQDANVESSNEFWGSFLNDDVRIDHHDYSLKPGSSDGTETESTSRYSENSSPHSYSSGSENAETAIHIEDSPTLNSDVFAYESYLASDIISERGSDDVSEVMDLGADVVIETSAVSICEESNHSIIEMPPQTYSSKSHKSSSTSRKKKDARNEAGFHSSVLQRLQLTDEEKRLIKKEGIHIPEHMPLTKAEERELKKIRRKIRNKHSAQESRRRKKDYVDGLEERIKICTSENLQLHKKVHSLENNQKSLMDQIRNLQNIIKNATGGFVAPKPVQTSTCLMVLVLSFALILFPSLFQDNGRSKLMSTTKSEMPPVSGNSRVLLSTNEVESAAFEEKVGIDNINKSQERQFAFESKMGFFDESNFGIESFSKDEEMPPLEKLEIGYRPGEYFEDQHVEDDRIEGYDYGPGEIKVESFVQNGEKWMNMKRNRGRALLK